MTNAKEELTKLHKLVGQVCQLIEEDYKLNLFTDEEHNALVQDLASIQSTLSKAHDKFNGSIETDGIFL